MRKRLPWEGVKDPARTLVVRRADVAALVAALGEPLNASTANVPRSGPQPVAIHVRDGGWELEGLTCGGCDTCKAENAWSETMPKAWPRSRVVAGYVFSIAGGTLSAGCQRVPLEVVRAGVAASDRVLHRSKSARRDSTIRVTVPRLGTTSHVTSRADGSLVWGGYEVGRGEVLRIKRALP